MRNSRILDAVNAPSDLKALTEEDLRILAQEIREQIIATTSVTGGHVASSLGAVEIILAAHSVLNAPKDKLIFDVGHQAYAHKLVTGRRDAFSTLRSYHGLSGFPRPSESPYDVHPSGHASDSLSVATGLAKARRLKGTDERIVALIGDAALSGGMAFEALNYMGQEQLPLVIILNDNEMSISRNVGALMKHLGNMRTTTQYRGARDALQERLESSGAAGRAMAQLGKNMKESMKQFVIPHSMIFEQLGIVCTAPIDGHDIHELRETLSLVLEMDAPVLMHVVTKKGAGYGPARKDPERFHGVGPYDIATGASTAPKAAAPTYTEVLGAALVREAAENPDVVAITAAMEGGTGLKPFAAAYPDRFIDVGIAEEQAVGMASGLAIGGKKPVVAVYSTFMQRAFDQMVVNVALPKLDVVFALDRAGLVGNDGPTHHGMFDMAYTRMVPNMRVLAPSDEAELASALHTALLLGGPFAIRYPRGAGVGAHVPEVPQAFGVGCARVVRAGVPAGGGAASADGGSSAGSARPDAAILAFGHMVAPAVAAADLLAERGVNVRVVDMRWVKPLDREAVSEAARTRLVVTVEEGIVAGGAGEGVLEVLSEMGADVRTCVLGIRDQYVLQGKTDLLLHDLGLDAEGIAASVQAALA